MSSKLKAVFGTYALVLESTCRVTITVGALGTVQVLPGFYVYIGSAFGPGGLRGRLLNHLRKRNSPHWHIDYLRVLTMPAEAWISTEPTRREHDWALALAESPAVSTPISRFGASDCRCPSHLFYLGRSWSRSSCGRLLVSIGASSLECVSGLAGWEMSLP